MPGPRTIVGSLLFVMGLGMIAYNKGVAQEFEEIHKLSRIWPPDGDYTFLWRILSIVLGTILVLIGAYVLLGSV